jgi:hypothetical protein
MNVKGVHFYSQGRLRQLERRARKLGQAASSGQWVRLLRIAAWFETLRCRSGLQNAYGLGEQIAPSGSEPHSNVWVKYAHAVHQPSEATLAAVDVKFPGSSIIFRSPIWHALDLTRPLNGTADSLIASLSAPAQLEYFDTDSLTHGLFVPRRRPLRRTAAALVELSSLDALAALVVMLRTAHEQRRSARCFSIGREIHDCLLLVGQDSHVQLIAQDLYYYFSIHIFPLTQCRGIAIASEPDQLQQQAQLVSSLVLELEDAGAIDYVPGYRKPLCRLVKLGFNGFGRVPLRPRLGTCGDRSNPTPLKNKLVRAWNDTLDRSLQEFAWLVEVDGVS